MAKNYQIDLVINAISKFGDVEKQLKKSLKNLSKMVGESDEETKKMLTKHYQKLFKTQENSIKSLSNKELQLLTKKANLEQSILKTKSLGSSLNFEKLLGCKIVKSPLFKLMLSSIFSRISSKACSITSRFSVNFFSIFS